VGESEALQRRGAADVRAQVGGCAERQQRVQVHGELERGQRRAG